MILPFSLWFRWFQANFLYPCSILAMVALSVRSICLQLSIVSLLFICLSYDGRKIIHIQNTHRQSRTEQSTAQDRTAQHPSDDKWSLAHPNRAFTGKTRIRSHTTACYKYRNQVLHIYTILTWKWIDAAIAISCCWTDL